MEFVSRAAWGAAAPKSTTDLPAKDVRGTAVHYSASEYDEAADHAQCAGRVKGIQAYHVVHNGWADIAYSWLTCQHGFIFEGRGWGRRTAAQGTNAGNDHYHAVCFLGGDKEGRDDVTPTGRQALAAVIADGRAHNPAGWEVRPHSDFHATACPGNELRQWLRADMPDDWTKAPPPEAPVPIVVKSKPIAIHGCATGGYWVATEDGGVFSFGGAPFVGSLGALLLNQPIVDLVGTKSGQGYWLCAADGGMFNFGDAPFVGSLAGTQLNAPMVDLAVSADDDGAWMLGGDGGVFGVGDAPYGGGIVYRT